LIRADLNQVYKILNNTDRVNKDKLFSFALDDRRGHSQKLYKSRFNLDIGKFANRVCDNWNCLLEHVVTSTSLNMFKNKLDSHLRENRGLNKFLKTFSPAWPPCATAHGGIWQINTGKFSARVSSRTDVKLLKITTFSSVN